MGCGGGSGGGGVVEMLVAVAVAVVLVAVAVAMSMAVTGGGGSGGCNYGDQVLWHNLIPCCPNILRNTETARQWYEAIRVQRYKGCDIVRILG